MKNKVYCIIGQVTGILSTLSGVYMGNFSCGAYENYKEYGGDAYTGIQNAAAQSANNIQDLAELTRFGFAALLIVLGVIVFCCFGIKKNESKMSLDTQVDNH